MLKKLTALLGLLSTAAFAGNVNVYSYASTNVTTSAYVVLWASIPTSASHLEICDTSTHLLKIATGLTGHEFDVATVAVSGCVVIPLYLAAGTQLNIKAIDASATTGYNTVGLF